MVCGGEPGLVAWGVSEPAYSGAEEVAMLRALPFVIAVVLTIYCLVEIAQSSSADVRTLPRGLWALLVLVPFAGAVGWLWLGRPTAAIGQRRTPSTRPTQIAPDDDPDFLRHLRNRRPGGEQLGWSADEPPRDDDGDGKRPE